MSDYTVISLITLLLLVVAVGIIMLVLIYQKKQLQYLNEKALMQNKFDKEILESRLEIQEQTMKRISQEMHDNIGQVLSVAKLNLNLMNCPDPVLQEKIADTTGLVAKAIYDLRDISKSLHSDLITEKGLLKAVEHDCDMLKRTGAYVTICSVDGLPYQLPQQKELILYRIFQEVVNNILKHANATQIDIDIHFKPANFYLSVKDNGKGFNTEEEHLGNSLGIRNIMNRSELIGASYHISSKEGEGTSVIIELPVQQLPANQ